jgi:hypothetical protein
MADTLGTDPVDSIVEEAVAVAADAAEAAAHAQTSPAAPAIGDAVTISARSGVVFGVCERDDRVFVMLAPGEDWLALS